MFKSFTDGEYFRNESFKNVKYTKVYVISDQIVGVLNAHPSHMLVSGNFKLCHMLMTCK
jgi:hypothetical protein